MAEKIDVEAAIKESERVIDNLRDQDWLVEMNHVRHHLAVVEALRHVLVCKYIPPWISPWVRAKASRCPECEAARELLPNIKEEKPNAETK